MENSKRDIRVRIIKLQKHVCTNIKLALLNWGGSFGKIGGLNEVIIAPQIKIKSGIAKLY